MFGQGRPHGCFRLLRRRQPTSWFAGPPPAVGPIALLLSSLFLAAAPCADQLDVRVRIAWGGGDARPWQGTIRLSEGTLSELLPLGLEPDAPGSMLLIDPATIRIYGRMPRSYDGCDVRVQAPAGAKLLVQLWADEIGGAPLEVPLARVVRDFTQFDLDDRKNRLLAQRSPGDGLRVSFSQASLVFAPREKFEIEVQPQQLDLASNSTYLLAAALGPARTEDHLWNEDREIRVDAAGLVKGVPLSIPLPEHEGVYDLRLSLYSKRLTLVRSKPLATRKVQLVVVAPVKNVAAQPANWQSVLEFDPASPKWWERMARLPSWTRLPTVPRPVESGPATTRTHLGRSWIELAPQAWQAYPLAIATPGLPHVLDVEYPSDIEQTLGISLIEPNAAGQVGPIGLDSGIDVPPPESGHKPGVRRHRLLFWPQTRTPYVLLVNRRDSGPAIFGKIDVQSGPLMLPPLTIPPTSFPTRTLAAYYDKPLFAENFSAPESVDPVSRRGLDDWVTFAAAGERLIQALQHGGYNALVLTAACEGSAIYPSRLLEPTAKYDSGVFFESGQDPVRKDVLELLFRLCDRSGIVLIPGVQFAGPLPELEAIRQTGGAESVGLEPLGPDGRTWLGRGGGQGGVGIYYNALDERVQRAMTAVVAELAEKYAHHASFGGVAVHLNPESYALLPDGTCSLDDVTFGRFLAETKRVLPPSDNPPVVARWDFLRRSAAQAWLDWRADKVAALYRQMRTEIARHRADARLYLTTANLLGARQWQEDLRPELPPREGESAMEILPPLMGLSLDRLASDGIVVPRPQRIVPSISAQARDQDQHWNRDTALDTLFARAARHSALHFLIPAPQRLTDFDAVSPFGPDKTRTLLISQIVPADAAQRERFVHSLATLDATLMIDGGWLLPLGQEPALAPLAKVYRRLPAEPFETVSPATPPEEASLSQEIIVRTLAKGDKTFFYVVNPTPWPLTAQLQFAASQPFRLVPYSDERLTNVQPTSGGANWTVDMEPFDLVGGEVAGSGAKVLGWSVNVPADAAHALSEKSRDVKARASYLRENPRPVAIVNPSFEARAADGSPAGWTHARGVGMRVEVDGGQGSGTPSSLHLVSRGAGAPLWVRSSPLSPPTTGRLQMTARIRIADATRPPQLRLAIEGRADGQVYYRRLTLGDKEQEADRSVPPLSTQWESYSIARTDLPVAGLSDFRVGFDLMSDGEVWIDDVQVQDLWLQESEFSELLKSALAGKRQVESGRLKECRLFVEGYWPSFLRRHVQLPEGREQTVVPAAAGLPRNSPPVTARPNQPIVPAPPPAPTGAQRPARSAERPRSWWPSWPWK